MKKVLKIEVDCAVCANKIQDALSKLEGINSVTVNFMTQKMIIDIDDHQFDEVYKKAMKLAKKIEPDFCVLEK